MFYLCATFFLFSIYFVAREWALQRSDKAFLKKLVSRIQSPDLLAENKSLFRNNSSKQIFNFLLSKNSELINQVEKLKADNNLSMKNEAGRQLAILNIASDLEQKKSTLEKEIQLRESFEKEKDSLLEILQDKTSLLESVVDSVAQGIVVSGVDGQILIFNDDAEKVLGIEDSEFIKYTENKGYGIFRENETAALEIKNLPVNEALKGKSLKNQVFFCKNPNIPEGRLISVNAEPIMGNNGKRVAALSTFRDITVERAEQEELASLNSELLRSNEELDRFAYIASHDLRSPLRAIGQLSTWIIEDEESNLSEESAENLELLRSRIIRFENLLESLLRYSRVGRESQDIEMCDSEALTIEVFKGLHNPNSAKLTTKELPKFTTKKTPFTIVVQNLLDNAVKHNSRKDGLIHVECRDLGAFFEFTVQDNGEGIELKYQEKIFEMFKTLQSRDKVEGSGIGLSIVKKIIESQGGRVWIEESKGPLSGAIFKFTWPK